MNAGVQTQLNSTAIDLVKHANSLVARANAVNPHEARVLKTGASLLASHANNLVSGADNVAIANSMAQNAQNVALVKKTPDAVVASLSKIGHTTPRGLDAPNVLVNVANTTMSRVVPYMSEQQKTYAVVNSIMNATNTIQAQELNNSRTSLASLGKKLGTMSNDGVMQGVSQRVLANARALQL